MQQRWSATEKEAFAVYQSVLKFSWNVRHAECILHCDHKPLEPFVSNVLKYLSLIGGTIISRLQYNVYPHWKQKYVLADVASSLKTDIYKEPLLNLKTPVVSNTQGHVMKIHATDIHTVSTTILCTECKWDIKCKN